MHLADVIPEGDVLIALEPDELGLCILQVLGRGTYSNQLELGSFLRSAVTGYPNHPQREEIQQAIREAWAWLEGQGLLLQDPHFGDGMRVVSRKGRRLAKEARARRALTGHRLAKDNLHWAIREDVWALYHRGKYDTAVFEAMKAVEVAVREVSGLKSEIGRDLMRKAFAVGTGPLTDKTAETGEQQARSDLFAGAIGAYKNPHSHRQVMLDDPNEAAEIILLANHLLRIVDGHARGTA